MCVCEHIHSGSSLCDVPEFLAAARDDIKEEPPQEDSMQPSSIFGVIECNQRHYFFITALQQLSSTSRNITFLSARAAPSSRCESIKQRKIKCEGRREAAARSGGLAVDSEARHRSADILDLVEKAKRKEMMGLKSLLQQFKDFGLIYLIFVGFLFLFFCIRRSETSLI